VFSVKIVIESSFLRFVDSLRVLLVSMFFARKYKMNSRACARVHTINLLTAITMGGTYDGDGASPIGRQGHVLCCSGR